MSGEADLAVVAAEVRACTLCPLATGRTLAVPGEGNSVSDVLLVGEGPGQREDATGRPFVGAAGQLLEEMLATIGWKRTDVFITNVVKCRPPGNRDPEPAEISACSPYLDRQERALDPVLIVTLGRHSLQRYLPGARISEAHGRLRRAGGRFVLPMYHPAAALRATALRETLVRDFQALPAALLEARAALEAEQADSGPSQSEPMGPGHPVGPGEEPLPTAPDDDQLTLF
jgi:uracil-DNA glycosylase family 4